MTFSGDEIDRMLKTLKGGGGSSSVDEAACEWVKNNVERWKYWVLDEAQNATAVETRITAMESDTQQLSFFGSFIILAVLVCFFLACAVLLWCNPQFKTRLTIKLILMSPLVEPMRVEVLTEHGPKWGQFASTSGGGGVPNLHEPCADVRRRPSGTD
jgi:hypothetical protein